MIRVWAVEDNTTFRNAVIQEINDSEGMRCDEAFSSCEALLEALQKGPGPDVILLDIRLPGLSGLEAISAVKAKSPETEILMLTTFDDQDRIFKALCAGASGYLLKTASADIPAAIREAVDGGAPLSPPIARSVLQLFSQLGPTPSDYHLTPRETSVLELMVKGMIKKEIAERLQVSYHTVDGHLRKIYRKLHVNNSAGAVAKAIRERLC
jgi:DNA-binding NarL/FixJ family response regulator